MAAGVRIISPGKFNRRGFRTALKAAAKVTGKLIERDFKKTTATWEHDVSFDIEVSADPNVEVSVTTTDKIYGYVNDGTDPHMIFPKRARALSFQWGGKGSYRPKTRPRVIGSTPGGPTGPQVARPYVQHPGTDPREFDVAIRDKWDRLLPNDFTVALEKGADASGHGYP